jgi:hypothetical protein
MCIQLPDRDQAVTPETFGFKLNWQKLREAPRREGSYLVSLNLALPSLVLALSWLSSGSRVRPCRWQGRHEAG